VVEYVDSSFGTHFDGSGATIFIGHGCTRAVSKKQKIAPKDSAEAELVALLGRCFRAEEHTTKVAATFTCLMLAGIFCYYIVS
jgi:hypothetical protein